MTNTEFAAWARHTERSKHGWQVDDVTYHNSGAVLMYHGGECGTYIYISGANVTVGRYEGAVPHIGEALFTPRGSRAFDTESEAYVAVISAAGLRALLALCGAL